MYLTAEYCVRQRDNIDYIIIVYISLCSECVICYYIRLLSNFFSREPHKKWPYHVRINKSVLWSVTVCQLDLYDITRKLCV